MIGKSLALAAVLIAGSTTPAPAPLIWHQVPNLRSHFKTLVIDYSPGGWVDEFDRHARRLAASHTQVIINGDCLSSCTRFFFPKWKLNICATENATLGFHMPYLIIQDPKTNIDRPIQTAQSIAWSEKKWKEEWLPRFSPAIRRWAVSVDIPNVSRGEYGFQKLNGKSLRGFVKMCSAMSLSLTYRF